jgi:hypothetical protein
MPRPVIQLVMNKTVLTQLLKFFIPQHNLEKIKPLPIWDQLPNIDFGC